MNYTVIHTREHGFVWGKIEDERVISNPDEPSFIQYEIFVIASEDGQSLYGDGMTVDEILYRGSENVIKPLYYMVTGQVTHFMYKTSTNTFRLASLAVEDAPEFEFDQSIVDGWGTAVNMLRFMHTSFWSLGGVTVSAIQNEYEYNRFRHKYPRPVR